MKTKLILASASPRRRALIEMLGVFDLTVIPAESEAPCPPELTPAEAVCFVSEEKAKDVARRVPGDSLILAADTVVSLEGRLLGKPRSPEEAHAMLRSLSGRKHTVYTGMALLRGERRLTDWAKTEVWFRELSDGEIDAYVATGSPLDKAGAYGAQDMAALFVERVDGEFYNVVGLPLCRLGQMLRAFGVPVLTHA